jgi:ligand-binding SRPBCC domain-containing protein
MPNIIVETKIQAPVELCFDLARDVEVHCLTAAHTKEKVVAGKTCGLLELGDYVTFEGIHFGVRQRLTSRVEEYNRPFRFIDQMISGAFKRLKHVHEFEPIDNGTLMRDTLEWESPLGVLGEVANRLFVKRHMRKFLLERNRELKKIAELRARDLTNH